MFELSEGDVCSKFSTPALLSAGWGHANMGVTRPFVCRGDDGALYDVKGRGAGRRNYLFVLTAGSEAYAAFSEIRDDLLLIDVQVAPANDESRNSTWSG